MSQVCIFLVLFKFVSVYTYPGETLMYLPPFEIRTVDRYPMTPQFQAKRIPQRQQQMLHTNVDQKPVRSSPEKIKTENITFSDFIEALNEIKMSHHKEPKSPEFRSATHDNDPPYHSYSAPYSPPNPISYGSTQAYQNSSPVAVTSEPELPKFPLVKPDLSTLFKPVSTKVSTKVSGLLDLILALFSGSLPDDLQMNGLKDLVINGIVKPLLVAKGGIKSLIGKLSIPLISLILINIEVLITVWWLWEDCEPQKYPVPTYSYTKPAYNYKNYNSYR